MAVDLEHPSTLWYTILQDDINKQLFQKKNDSLLVEKKNEKLSVFYVVFAPRFSEW